MNQSEGISRDRSCESEENRNIKQLENYIDECEEAIEECEEATEECEEAIDECDEAIEEYEEAIEESVEAIEECDEAIEEVAAAFTSDEEEENKINVSSTEKYHASKTESKEICSRSIPGQLKIDIQNSYPAALNSDKDEVKINESLTEDNHVIKMESKESFSKSVDNNPEQHEIDKCIDTSYAAAITSKKDEDKIKESSTKFNLVTETEGKETCSESVEYNPEQLRRDIKTSYEAAMTLDREEDKIKEPSTERNHIKNTGICKRISFAQNVDVKVYEIDSNSNLRSYDYLLYQRVRNEREIMRLTVREHRILRIESRVIKKAEKIKNMFEAMEPGKEFYRIEALYKSFIEKKKNEALEALKRIKEKKENEALEVEKIRQEKKKKKDLEALKRIQEKRKKEALEYAKRMKEEKKNEALEAESSDRSCESVDNRDIKQLESDIEECEEAIEEFWEDIEEYEEAIEEVAAPFTSDKEGEKKINESSIAVNHVSKTESKETCSKSVDYNPDQLKGDIETSNAVVMTSGREEDKINESTTEDNHLSNTESKETCFKSVQYNSEQLKNEALEAEKRRQEKKKKKALEALKRIQEKRKKEALEYAKRMKEEKKNEALEAEKIIQEKKKKIWNDQKQRMLLLISIPY